jgi:CBS domain-containing protein
MWGERPSLQEGAEMKLREIMTPSPVFARPTDTLSRVAEMMQQENVGAIPVVENDRLVGIITDRDVTVKAVAAGEDPKEALVSDYMSADLVTGRPDMSDREALELMGREQIRRLPIVENGRLVGMVAMADFALESDREEEVEATLEEISQPVR